MLSTFKNLPDLYQGIIYFLAGAVLFLYALGIIEKGITLIIIIFALCMIGVGAVKMGLYKKGMDTLDKIKK